MKIHPPIELTADGSQTLRHPVFREGYHSDRGAVGESIHVFIEAGLSWYVQRQIPCRDSADSALPDGVSHFMKEMLPDSATVLPIPQNPVPPSGKRRLSVDTSPEIASVRGDLYTPVRILEVGFGSGLNGWLTARYAQKNQLSVYYETLELYPVGLETVHALDYAQDPLYRSLHTAEWEVAVPVTPQFTLKKRAVSLIDCNFDLTFDLVYFDAFAPETQPELWTGEVFGTLYRQMNWGGGLVTYSAKGLVKQNLRAAGFDLQRLPGALGKRHMLRAVKQ